MWLFLLLLYLAASFEVVVGIAAVWLPPVAFLVVLAAVRRLASSTTVRTAVARTVRTVVRAVRRTVRTVSGRCPRRTPFTPLTSPDTCPGLSADNCPDVSGRTTDGGPH